MPQPPSVKTYAALRPLSWLYATAMQLRNRRFDNGGLRTESFPLPVISVGNISVGGTGKTPMCAYLLGLLHGQGLHPTLLSRGYGRKTKGYRAATPQSSAAEIGDEPRELYKMYGGKIPVCVCENRCEGARRILNEIPTTDTLILDDAYQHRHIHRDINIMLTDYNRLYTRDRVLPEGMLRERPSGASRADIIIVTKCPPSLTVDDAAAINTEIKPLPHQHIFYTSITYAPLALNNQRAFLFTGIAKPQPLINHLRSQCAQVDVHCFADHHAFGPADTNLIIRHANNADIVVTTAKDYSRLPSELIEKLGAKLLVQHIGVEFLFGQAQKFNTLITQAIATKQQQQQ